MSPNHPSIAGLKQGRTGQLTRHRVKRRAKQASQRPPAAPENRRHLSARRGLLIIAASLPAIGAAALLTIPNLLFPTPGHNAYFHFARELQHEPLVHLPVVLGLACVILSCRRFLG